MKKFFGTDGIRGVANEFLTPELAFKLGRVLGFLISKKNKKPYVYVGKDTRQSSPMLEYSLISGFLSSGIDVKRLHQIPTPCVAYLTKSTEAAMGVMISASHNPFYDNGIKIFGSNGMKLTDTEELKIEELLTQEDTLTRAINEELGVVLNRHESMYQYVESLFFSVKNRFDGLRIGLDCANGATYQYAKRLFVRLGAEVIVINANPNGININDKCGSTHLEQIKELVIKNNLDVGFAFDGDGDRVIAIDELGNEIDGDYILYILGKYNKDKGNLKQNRIVTTIMSNMGLFKVCEDLNITISKTKVGDRYVLESMLESGCNIGGEQSGHIIMLDYNTCGDGMLVALQITSILKESNLRLSELSNGLKKYPQMIGKLRVVDKEAIMLNQDLQSLIKKCNNELGGKGRILVRPSGTEPVIRVMSEAVNEDLCYKYYDLVYQSLEKLI